MYRRRASTEEEISGFDVTAMMDPTTSTGSGFQKSYSEEPGRPAMVKKRNGERKKSFSSFWSNLFGSKIPENRSSEQSSSSESVNTTLSTNSFSFVNPRKYKGKQKGKRIPLKDDTLDRLQQQQPTKQPRRKIGTLTRIGMKIGLKSKYNLQSCESLHNLNYLETVTTTTINSPTGTLNNTLNRKKRRAPSVPPLPPSSSSLLNSTLPPVCPQPSTSFAKNHSSSSGNDPNSYNNSEVVVKASCSKTTTNNEPNPSSLSTSNSTEKGTSTPSTSSTSEAISGGSNSNNCVQQQQLPTPFKITASHRRCVSEGSSPSSSLNLNSNTMTNTLRTKYHHVPGKRKAPQAPKPKKPYNPFEDEEEEEEEEEHKVEDALKEEGGKKDDKIQRTTGTPLYYNGSNKNKNNSTSYPTTTPVSSSNNSNALHSSKNLKSVTLSNAPSTSSPPPPVTTHTLLAGPSNGVNDNRRNVNESTTNKSDKNIQHINAEVKVVVAPISPTATPSTSLITSTNNGNGNISNSTSQSTVITNTNITDEQDEETVQNLLNDEQELQRSRDRMGASGNITNTTIPPIQIVDETRRELDVLMTVSNNNNNSSSSNRNSLQSEISDEQARLQLLELKREAEKSPLMFLHRKSKIGKENHFNFSGLDSTYENRNGNVTNNSLTPSPQPISSSTLLDDTLHCPTSIHNISNNSLLFPTTCSTPPLSSSPTNSKITPRPWYKRSTSSSSPKKTKQLIKPVSCMTKFSDIDREAARIIAENKRRSAEQSYNETARELITMFNAFSKSQIPSSSIQHADEHMDQVENAANESSENNNNNRTISDGSLSSSSSLVIHDVPNIQHPTSMTTTSKSSTTRESSVPVQLNESSSSATIPSSIRTVSNFPSTSTTTSTFTTTATTTKPTSIVSPTTKQVDNVTTNINAAASSSITNKSNASTSTKEPQSAIPSNNNNNKNLEVRINQYKVSTTAPVTTTTTATVATSPSSSSYTSLFSSSPFGIKKNDWHCPRCTLKNLHWRSTCEACYFKVDSSVHKISHTFENKTIETVIPPVSTTSSSSSSATSFKSLPSTSTSTNPIITNKTTTPSTAGVNDEKERKEKQEKTIIPLCENFLSQLPSKDTLGKKRKLHDNGSIVSENKDDLQEKVNGEELDIIKLRQARLAFFDKNSINPNEVEDYYLQTSSSLSSSSSAITVQKQQTKKENQEIRQQNKVEPNNLADEKIINEATTSTSIPTTSTRTKDVSSNIELKQKMEKKKLNNVFSDDEDDSIDALLQIPNIKSIQTHNVHTNKNNNSSVNSLRLHENQIGDINETTNYNDDETSFNHNPNNMPNFIGPKNWNPLHTMSMNRFRPMLESIVESSSDIYLRMDPIYENIKLNQNQQAFTSPSSQHNVSNGHNNNYKTNHSNSSIPIMRDINTYHVSLESYGRNQPSTNTFMQIHDNTTFPHISPIENNDDNNNNNSNSSCSSEYESSVVTNRCSSDFSMDGKNRPPSRRHSSHHHKYYTREVLEDGRRESGTLTLEDYQRLGAIPKNFFSSKDEEHSMDDQNGSSTRRHSSNEKSWGTQERSFEENTFAVNRLLKELERAIANGDHKLAASFAHDLALLRVNCRVAKGEKPAVSITLRVYVEDRFLQQGPFLVSVFPEMTVKELKSKIESDWGIPTPFQRWILGKKISEDDQDHMSDFDIGHDSMAFLYLVTPQIPQKKEVGEGQNSGPSTYNEIQRASQPSPSTSSSIPHPKSYSPSPVINKSGVQKIGSLPISSVTQKQKQEEPQPAYENCEVSDSKITLTQKISSSKQQISAPKTTSQNTHQLIKMDKEINNIKSSTKAETSTNTEKFNSSTSLTNSNQEKIVKKDIRVLVSEDDSNIKTDKKDKVNNNKSGTNNNSTTIMSSESNNNAKSVVSQKPLEILKGSTVKNSTQSQQEIMKKANDSNASIITERVTSNFQNVLNANTTLPITTTKQQLSALLPNFINKSAVLTPITNLTQIKSESSKKGSSKLKTKTDSGTTTTPSDFNQIGKVGKVKTSPLLKSSLLKPVGENVKGPTVIISKERVIISNETISLKSKPQEIDKSGISSSSSSNSSSSEKIVFDTKKVVPDVKTTLNMNDSRNISEKNAEPIPKRRTKNLKQRASMTATKSEEVNNQKSDCLVTQENIDTAKTTDKELIDTVTSSLPLLSKSSKLASSAQARKEEEVVVVVNPNGTKISTTTDSVVNSTRTNGTSAGVNFVENSPPPPPIPEKKIINKIESSTIVLSGSSSSLNNNDINSIPSLVKSPPPLHRNSSPVSSSKVQELNKTSQNVDNQIETTQLQAVAVTKASETSGQTIVTPEKEDAPKVSAMEEKREDNLQTYELLKMMEQTDIIPNMEEIDCPICFSTVKPKEGMVLRDCLHSFCKECLIGSVQYAEEPEVKCPFRDNQYTCHSIIQEREIKALVPPEIFEKHLARSVKIAECKIVNTFHCKTADCTGWCVFEDDVNVFKCPVCLKKNCLTCQSIHEGMDCQQYQRQLAIDSETDENAKSSRLMLEKMIQRGEALECPQCHVVLLKKWGCDWVRCSYCKVEICWVTKQARWGPLGKGDVTGGCKCGVNNVKCHPKCTYCH